VQGGLLAAMLDDTLGPALVATLDDGQWAPTIDLQIVPETGKAGTAPRRRPRGAKRFLAGELRGAHGSVVATATACAIIRSR
jgi:hypothetical protein